MIIKLNIPVDIYCSECGETLKATYLPQDENIKVDPCTSCIGKYKDALKTLNETFKDLNEAV
jgi:hypothetical protein